jgi:cell filamentation protein
MDCYECREDKSNFITALTKHYADMNALHPFREGNGRTQREFARELCMECGYVLDLTETTHQEMLDASIASFNRGDNTGFISIFSRVVIPYDEYRNYQQKLNSTLLILSKDDM